jgi:hypothetical protein
MAEMQNPGEDKAWGVLGSLPPDSVCRSAAVSYDAATESYTLASLGMDFVISVKNRTISSSAEGSAVLLQKLGFFFRLSVLWYLARAKEIDCTGRPVKLEQIRGGDIFTRGSHILPLDGLAKKYGKDRTGFLEKGTRLGGELVKTGDASIKLYPLPRIPVVLTLWLEDEEFPAGADLFFDSTCDLQLPTDIIWSIAMMSILIML